ESTARGTPGPRVHGGAPGGLGPRLSGSPGQLLREITHWPRNAESRLRSCHTRRWIIASVAWRWRRPNQDRSTAEPCSWSEQPWLSGCLSLARWLSGSSCCWSTSLYSLVGRDRYLVNL